MTERRVAITGMGVISALGHNAGDFWTALRAGQSGIRPIAAVDRTKLRFSNGAEVPDYRPLDFLTAKEIDVLDRFAQFGLIAARQAVAGSRIDWKSTPRARTAVVTGSCLGGQTTEDQAFVDLYREGRERVHPMSIPRAMSNAAASAIALEWGLRGPAFTVSTACSSANHAIGQAFWMVRGGAVDVAIAGGSEAPFSMGLLKAWEAMRVVSPDTCRPFSRDRGGLILGEGGGMLLLECMESARSRGATILGEIVGFGMSADAHHITQPLADGAADAMRAALDDARVEGADVGYINAHGTGTLSNDATETRAIEQVFGPHAKRLAVSSTKSMHGHALGAAGAIEAVATVLALRNGIAPPTANYIGFDPACDLDVVPNESRPCAAAYALSNSFAFGGLNAVLVFKKPEN